jgi:hypothetical protein
MSSRPLLGAGQSFEVDENDSLRRKVERLESEVADVRRQLREAKLKLSTANLPLLKIQKLLGPWHDAINELYGEFDGVEFSSSPQNKNSAVWESWKQKLGGGTAKVIDALLLHGEANTIQLSIATGLHRTTIPALIHKLNKASLINKNGGKFSLKEL